MPQHAANAMTRVYAVEVSGWDSALEFFVERCDLVWSEDCGKLVRLSQALGERTIVFVRLLQPGQSEKNHPVAYEVESAGELQSGLRQFRLKMVTPRMSAAEPPAAKHFRVPEDERPAPKRHSEPN